MTRTGGQWTRVREPNRGSSWGVALDNCLAYVWHAFGQTHILRSLWNWLSWKGQDVKASEIQKQKI